MNDLLTNSPKFGAKFSLMVTLFALLAACSHKAVRGDSAELAPIPANEVVDSQYTPSASEASETNHKDVAATPARAPHRHARFKKRAHFPPLTARNSRPNRAHKSPLVVSQVQASPPPPPPEAMATPMPETVAPVVAPPPPMPMALSASSGSGHGWLIWAIIAGCAATLVLGYRATRGSKKARRLIFNS